MARLVAFQPEASLRALVPCLDWERELWNSGALFVAGLDEVGRGPLAGPLLAAAVVLPPPATLPWLEAVRDSKVLPPKTRETLAAAIRREAVGVGLGAVSARDVDRLGVVRATHRAMRRALRQLGQRPNHLLIDAFPLPRTRIPQTALVHGDGRCVSIACASIVAKVARDALMCHADARYPGYGFARNKGYGTADHLDALRRLGPSPIHRRTFAPVRALSRRTTDDDSPAG